MAQFTFAYMKATSSYQTFQFSATHWYTFCYWKCFPNIMLSIVISLWWAQLWVLKSQCWLEMSRLIIDTHSCTFMKVVPVATLLVCYHGISPLSKNNSNLVSFATFSLYFLPTFRCVSAFELVLMGTWIIDDAFTETPKWIYEEGKFIEQNSCMKFFSLTSQNGRMKI